MGTAAPKKRPMRSKKSGTKKFALVKANLAILKKLAALLIIILLVGCDAPYHIVETVTTDSTGKQVHTIHKYYENSTVVPQASFNIVTTPYFYNYRPYYIPPVVVPVRPYYAPRPSYRGRH
jgi:hypothetical protein